LNYEQCKEFIKGRKKHGNKYKGLPIEISFRSDVSHDAVRKTGATSITNVSEEFMNSNKILISEWKTTFKEHEQRRKRNK